MSDLRFRSDGERRRRRMLPAGIPGRFFLIAAAIVIAACAFAADLLTVVQRETAIRKEKRLLSEKVAVLKEGDRVAKLGEEGSWLRVEYQGAEGWLPRSAVSSDKKVVLSDEAASKGVRATEQSAGGRGFNADVESRHRSSRIGLQEAYRIVDRIQNRKFAEDRVAQFLREGKLGEGTVQSAGIQEGERPAPPWKR